MDPRAAKVLVQFHDRIRAERSVERAPDRSQRFMAVGPETGQLIDLLAGSLERPRILELGTSFGYSTLWLANAARRAGGHVTTVEAVAEKSARAREAMEEAGLGDVVTFRVGDALEVIAKMPAGIDFVLLDLWKVLYVPCLELLRPKLSPGAILVADNMVRPGGDAVRAYETAVRAMPGLLSCPIPVGSGLEVSRVVGLSGPGRVTRAGKPA